MRDWGVHRRTLFALHGILPPKALEALGAGKEGHGMTLLELIQLDPSTVTKLPGCGPFTFRRLVERLSELGLHFVRKLETADLLDEIEQLHRLRTFTIETRPRTEYTKLLLDALCDTVTASSETLALRLRVSDDTGLLRSKVGVQIPLRDFVKNLRGRGEVAGYSGKVQVWLHTSFSEDDKLLTGWLDLTINESEGSGSLKVDTGSLDRSVSEQDSLHLIHWSCPVRL